MSYQCDAHFDANGVAVCSCTEAERFNSAPRDDDADFVRCELCGRLGASKTIKMVPGFVVTAVCDKCYQKVMAEPLDPNTVY